jgi:hypothetical protein
MLNDRPEERDTLFRDIVLKKTSVRMAEQLARRIAQDKIRKRDKTPEVMEMEKSLTETLGTRVLIENRQHGGRLLIEFFSPDDLAHIVAAIAAKREAEAHTQAPVAPVEAAANTTPVTFPNTTPVAEEPEDLYSVRNFSV